MTKTRISNPRRPRKQSFAEMSCRICSCTEIDPCVGEQGQTCAWAALEFCSSCAARIAAILFADPEAIPLAILPWLLESFESMGESGLWECAFGDEIEFRRALNRLRDLATPRVLLASEGDLDCFLRQARAAG